MTQRPVLMGFDLATQVGWCAGDGSRLPVLDSFQLRATGADVGSYLLEAEEYFGILLDRFEPSHAIYEAPLTMPNQTPEVTTKLHALPGVLEMCVVRRQRQGMQTTVQKVYPVSIKSKVGGSGRASKDDVRAAIRRTGMAPKNKDESDAAGAWLCGVHHYSPDLWPAWQGRLQGADLD